jgi:hypothetical protein
MPGTGNKSSNYLRFREEWFLTEATAAG